MKVFKQALAPLSGLLLASIAGTASAVVAHVEEGDWSTGTSTSIATFVGGGTAVGDAETSLTGDLGVSSSNFNDEDVFLFTINNGATATADITSLGGGFGIVNPAITLMEFNGIAWVRKEANNPGVDTVLSYTNTGDTNQFALIVTNWGNNPSDNGGNALYPDAYTGSTLAGFSGAGNASFNYSIATTGLSAATVVPVPAAVWLFGSGLLGLVGVARRKA